MDRRTFAAVLGAIGLGSVDALPEGVVVGGGSGGANDPEILQLS